MVVSAIDENQWTADRIKFFDFESKSNNKNKILSIISRKDDTNIQLMFSPE